MSAEPVPGPAPWQRWFALLGGMAAYATHLIGSYYALPAACALRTRVPLYVLTAIALAVAVAATWTGWRHRNVPGPEEESLARPHRSQRARFMSRAGLFLSLLATLTIVSAGAATLLFDPCENWV